MPNKTSTILLCTTTEKLYNQPYSQATSDSDNMDSELASVRFRITTVDLSFFFQLREG